MTIKMTPTLYNAILQVGLLFIRDHLQACLNRIYKETNLSTNLSFPTIFDVYCDLHQRGAITNNTIHGLLKEVIKIFENRWNKQYSTDTKDFDKIKHNLEAWVNDYILGLSNCVSLRSILHTQLKQRITSIQEFAEKGFYFKQKDYSLRELGKYYEPKFKRLSGKAPLEQALFGMKSLSPKESDDLDKINTILAGRESVVLPSRDVFLASYRIEKNLEIAKNSFGDKKLIALKNAYGLGHTESSLSIAKYFFNLNRYIESIEWLVRSLKVESLNGESAYLIALILDKYNQPNAREYYELAAKNNYIKSFLKLAQLCINSDHFEEGIRWYDKAAKGKDPEALYKLGNFYFYGLTSIEKNLQRAFELYSEAAKGGVRSAAYCVGLMHLNGIAVKQSSTLAEKYFRKTEGHPGAMCALAMMYINTPKQEEWVKYHLLSAGLDGNALALNLLGKLLKTKLFISSSISNFLFINSALMGNPNALNNLVMLWREGAFVSHIPFDADEYLKIAMKEGDADAMVNYARYCLAPDEQLTYFRQAAKKNSIEAYYQLGEMYAHGHEVKQSYENAALLFSGAAKRGHSEATYKLAQFYEEGLGVPQSRAVAQQLYSKAAQMGSWDAKFASWGMTLEDCGQELYQALENAEKRITLMLEKDK